MSLFNAIPFVKKQPKVLRQVLSTLWKDRKQVLEEDVNLFCWCRTLSQPIEQFLVEILGHSPEPIRYAVTRDSLSTKIEQAKLDWGMNAATDGAAFWEDVYQVVYDFLEFSKNGEATMHLRIVANDACTKFHTDGFPLRLFTTYAGMGTEWLPEAAVNRKALGTKNEDIIKDSAMIQRIETGHVSILKGEAPGQSRHVKGIVHRSPEITNLGQKRIILRVDL